MIGECVGVEKRFPSTKTRTNYTRFSIGCANTRKKYHCDLDSLADCACMYVCMCVCVCIACEIIYIPNQISIRLNVDDGLQIHKRLKMCTSFSKTLLCCRNEQEGEGAHTYPYEVDAVCTLSRGFVCCRLVCHCRQFSLIASLVISFIYSLDMREIQFFRQRIFHHAHVGI